MGGPLTEKASSTTLMILLLDNYDSFVYNLARYLRECGQEVEVLRNDQITVEEAQNERYEAIVISPGPSNPKQAGISIELVKLLSGVKPILGICLGHQAIAEAFGGRVVCSRNPKHGVASPIFHNGKSIFEGLPSPLQAGRYHSLIASPSDLPEDLEVLARCLDGNREIVMAYQHRKHLTIGLQFHPESILTPEGHTLIQNFLTLSGLAEARPQMKSVQSS